MLRDTKEAERRRLLAAGMLAGGWVSLTAQAQTNTGASPATAGAGAATTRSVSRDGARLHVELEGRGEPILLLHGGLGHLGWFDELRRHLVARGRQVVLVDTRGMGRSSLGASLSYAAQEADATAVLDALGLARVDLVGFSDGGIVGYRMASRTDSRVRRLVTIGSRWSAENGRGMWPAFDGWNRKSLSEGPFKFIVDDYDRLNPDRDFDRLMKAAVAMWKDDGPQGHPGAQIERIAQPVLVSVGDGDPFLSVADAAIAKARIKNAQLLVVPAATHPAYRERPDVFMPALDRFLASSAT
jgi:pimeloyl-ACP methyl ester carboxylesterase